VVLDLLAEELAHLLEGHASVFQMVFQKGSRKEQGKALVKAVVMDSESDRLEVDSGSLM
jgi:hypothetical protein